MNLLSQILPGVREFRTPFASGALWAFALLLAAQLLPREIRADLARLLTNIDHYTERYQAVLLIPTASIAVYLLGVAASVLTNSVLKILGTVNWFTLGFLAVFACSWIVLLWASRLRVLWLVLLLVVVVLAAVYISRNKSGDRSHRVGEFIHDLLRFLAEETPRLAHRLLNELSAAWNPSREQINQLMEEDLARQVTGSSTFRTELIARIPYRDIAQVLDRLGARLPDELQRPDFIPKSATSWSEIDTDIAKGKRWVIFNNRELSDWIRDRLRVEFETNDEAARSFVTGYTRTKEHRQDAARRLQAAQVRLKIDQPGLWNEWDRLQAERDFRSAVALPVSFICACATMLIGRYFEWGTLAFFHQLASKLARLVFSLYNDRTTTKELENLRSVAEIVTSAGNGLAGIPISAVVAIALGFITLAVFASAARQKDAESLQILYAAIQQAVIEPKAYGSISVDRIEVGPPRWFSLLTNR